MAIDTRNKRASTIGLALPFVSVAPNPDGSLADAADRRQMSWLYALSDSASNVFCVVAKDLFVSGAVKHDLFVPGSEESDIFVPGAREHEICQ